MILASLCPLCKHWQGNDKCAAFPDGIPEKILIGDIFHNHPYPDDHGFKYERKYSPEELLEKMEERTN